MISIFRLAAGAAAVCALAACTITLSPTGPTLHESKVIDADKFEMSRIELRMGAGELNLQGGSSQLLEADFQYNVPAWKPLVESNAATFRADVRISQPTGVSASGHAVNKWDLRISDRLPTNLIAHLGAGNAQMVLGSVDLENLEVHMGVGKLMLDLRGQPKRDYTANIEGGVGEAAIYVPNDEKIGVSATAKGGIGEISVEGLERGDHRWLSRGYDRAPVRIHLEVAGGVGAIRLIAQ
ncbi:MAG TPA: toast rack family protein [Bryobacteraceae bacterium]|nr:toast rack family protein [Bryobacteraceae bacterium]